MKKAKVLIVDDEPLIRKSLSEVLGRDGYDVTMAETAEDGIQHLNSFPVDIVVTDFKLPKMTGMDLLEFIKKEHVHVEVIMITGHASVEMAVSAMRKGAYDYVTKPINDEEVKVLLNKILEKQGIIHENKALKKIIAEERRRQYCGMIGASSKMQQVYHIVDSVASSNATILITGESGTGKGLVARAIHETDTNRKNRPFIEISCGALSETLLESELFGHVKGSFTGAIKDKEGRFEYAKGGTIFLDEIDTFSPNLQVKLLRVLQDGVFERVGDNQTRTVGQARIIVATNQDLLELIGRGDFREDLYYRINVIAVKTPPLRERKEDLESLVEHFVRKYCELNKKVITEVSEEVMRILKEYPWPGNIRELENVIEGAVIMSPNKVINKWDIPHLERLMQSKSIQNDENHNLKKIIEQPEKQHILSVLEEVNWNRNRAAAALGVNRTTLYNKMKKYNIYSQIK